MNDRFNWRSPFAPTFVLLTLVGVLLLNGAHGEPNDGRPRKIGDMFWVWGNPEMTEPGEHSYANFREASPARRTRMLGQPT